VETTIVWPELPIYVDSRKKKNALCTKQTLFLHSVTTEYILNILLVISHDQICWRGRELELNIMFVRIMQLVLPGGQRPQYIVQVQV
jgi:hypothetical protein